MEDVMKFLSTRAAFVGLLALATACDGGEDTATHTDTDGGDTDTTCESSISTPIPAEGDEVYYRSMLTVEFGQDEAGSATMALTDSAGTDIAGTSSFSTDGTVGYFTPDAALTPDSDYTLTVAYSCDKTADVNFSTSDIGTPVADAGSIVDAVFNIDITSGRVVEPEGVGDLLLGLIPEDSDINILVSATDYDADNDEVMMRGALGVTEGGNIVQDICTPHIDFPEVADFSENPYFSIEGENVAIDVQDIAIEIDSLAVSGAYASDLSSIQGVEVAGLIDARKIDLGDSSDLGDLCALAAAFTECIPCDDGEAQCLRLRVIDVEALQTSTDGLVEVDEGNLDPSCSE